jgi:hypothetical protein
LHRARAWDKARVVEVTDDLPAAGSAVPCLVPHIHVKSIYGVCAKVDKQPGPREVGGGLHLGLVDGGIEIPSISGNAQGAPYLLKPWHRKRGDNQRNEHHHEYFER